MAWDTSESVELNVNEVGAGDGAFGPEIELQSNEMCRYTVHRDDGLSGDRWMIEVVPISAGAGADNAPHDPIMLEDTETIKSIRIWGWDKFKVKIMNAEYAPADIVTTNHYWKKNGVNI